jgi:hypothetical protein
MPYGRATLETDPAAKPFQSMLKSSILNYHTSLKNTIKSGSLALWVILIIFIPAVLSSILFIFQSEAAAALMTAFPLSSRQGLAFYRDFVHLAGTEILWLGLFCLLTFVLAVYPSQAAVNNFLNIKVTKAAYYMMLIASAFFLTTVFISQQTLEEFPNSSDEYAYLFQAELFSRGKLWERTHDLPDFFYLNNIAQHDGIVVSRFPPGWPLFLSAAFEAGLQPSLVNPVLALITLIIFYFFARRYYGEREAVWALMALAFTGYYIFNSASYFSLVSSLLVTLLFVFNVYLYQEKNNFVYGVLAGFFLGVVVTIRYYTAIFIFVPFLVYLLLQHGSGAFKIFLWMALGSIPCLAYLSWYNYSITGSALMPVTVWANEQLGLVKEQSLLKGVEHIGGWTLLFFYWCSPGLLILYAVFLWRKIQSPAERLLHPEDYAFITLIAGYVFYYEISGNQYGPQFLFEALPFLILFVVRKVLQLRAKWAMAIFIASLFYGIAKLPFIMSREERITDERQDLYDLVRQKKITNAVVFVASSTSPTRPMPAPDLTRNDARFLNDVIYALELPKINGQLMEYYSDRSFYRYVRDVDHPEGELIRIK